MLVIKIFFCKSYKQHRCLFICNSNILNSLIDYFDGVADAARELTVNDANHVTMASNTFCYSLSLSFCLLSLSAPVSLSDRLNNSRPFSGLDCARLPLTGENRSVDGAEAMR